MKSTLTTIKGPLPFVRKHVGGGETSRSRGLDVAPPTDAASLAGISFFASRSRNCRESLRDIEACLRSVRSKL